LAYEAASVAVQNFSSEITSTDAASTTKTPNSQTTGPGKKHARSYSRSVFSIRPSKAGSYRITLS